MSKGSVASASNEVCCISYKKYQPAEYGLHKQPDSRVIIKSLGDSKSLYVINANLFFNQMNKIITVLARDSSIKKLYFDFCKISEGSATALARHMYENEHLTKLYLASNVLNPKGLKNIINSLPFSKNLESLNLNGHKVLAKSPLSGCIPMIYDISSLFVLHLSFTNLGDNGLIRLSETLINNHTLTKLFLNGINITNKGVEAFADMLSLNQGLKSVYLGWNNLDADSAELISAGIKYSSPNLSVVNLANNRIDMNGALKLASSSGASMCELPSVNLSNNAISDNEAELLIQMQPKIIIDNSQVTHQSAGDGENEFEKVSDDCLGSLSDESCAMSDDSGIEISGEEIPCDLSFINDI